MKRRQRDRRPCEELRNHFSWTPTLCLEWASAIPLPSYEPRGPYGAKEVGEGSMVPVLGSIANAIYDAIGVRMTELPITPRRSSRR